MLTVRRCASRFVLPAVAILAAAAPALPAQGAAATPEAFANRYFATLVAGDFAGNAALMHPSALAAMRKFVTAIGTGDSTGRALEQVLGVTDKRTIAALSDVALYERFVRTTLGAEPGVLAAMQSARVEVVGHVDEGADVTHIVYRMTMKLGDLQSKKTDVLTLKRDGKEWRALLTGDIENAIARMSPGG